MKPASLSGRVLKKSDGTGIPGAIVSITRAELINQILSNAEDSLVVVTDAQGAWKLAPVLPGTYFVAATANGFLPGTRAKLVVDSGDAQANIDLTLDAGGVALTGTVADVGGGPIADARITVKREWDFELTGSPELVTMTKHDGTYQLTLAEGDYEVQAAHDDYTSSRANVEIAKDPVKRDFVLTPGAVIRGQVIARDSGKPVPGAFIVADVTGQGGETTRADDSGAFVLRGLKPGAVSIKAQGPGYASASPTVVEIAIGEQVDGVRVLVERAFSISGHVVRKGKPDEGVPGVQLGVLSIATQQFGIALEPTDDDGAFAIHGVRPASYMIFAGGEGNVPEVGKAVDVVDKDVTDVVIEMSTGVTLAGRVEPPVEGARVTLKLTGGIGIAQLFDMAKAMLAHATTDATGAFTVRNAPAGAFTLVAAAKTGDTGELPLVIGEVDQQGLVVKLETRASISGRVVDDKGVAVTDATITADRTDDDKAAFSMAFNGRNAGSTLRADGSFKIVGLEAGTYALSARDNNTYDSLKFAGGKAPKHELAKGQQLANVVVTVEARDGVIRGVVIGADKKPIADAWVTAERPRPDFKAIKKEDVDDETLAEARDWSMPSKPVLTGADGRFTIERLRRGTYKLVAVGPRGASRGEATDVKTGSSATITLLSLGTLTGKVTIDGKPVAAYDIECDGAADDVDTKAIEDATGVYRLERLAPGTYECSVTADAGTAKGKVDVPPGEAKLDFALDRWGVITGKVVDVLQKKPVAGVVVIAGASGGFGGAREFENMLRGRSPKTDASGVFTLDRVPAGTGAVTFMGSELSFGDNLATKPYTIASGQRIDLGTIEVVPPRKGDAGTFGFATNIDDKGRLVVSSVKDGGPAAGAGMKEGDVITALSGMTVESLTPLVAQKLLSSGTVGVGIPVMLTIERGGSPVTASLVSVKW